MFSLLKRSKRKTKSRMSSLPGYTLEAFIGDAFFRITKEQEAKLVEFYESEREYIESKMLDFDEETQSWRDYRNSMFECLPEAPKELYMPEPKRLNFQSILGEWHKEYRGWDTEKHEFANEFVIHSKDRHDFIKSEESYRGDKELIVTEDIGHRDETGRLIFTGDFYEVAIEGKPYISIIKFEPAFSCYGFLRFQNNHFRSVQSWIDSGYNQPSFTEKGYLRGRVIGNIFENRDIYYKELEKAG